jgi:(1->4)-alpha-D-glucan 1-alpha-D-glucosylmutase
MQDLLKQVTQWILDRRRLPEATYRLQFHKGFTFQDAARIAPYLRELGITHLYASPYLQARPGSTHGYDITRHDVLNPEIGSPEDHQAMAQALHENGLGQILDTVPNHMGIVGNENVWWNDVLENGPASPYANFFDIAWEDSPRTELCGRVLLPTLGEPYGKILESGQLRLEYTISERVEGGPPGQEYVGSFSVVYYDHRFPIAPRIYGLILAHQLDELQARLPAEDPSLSEYMSILTSIKHLPRRTQTGAESVAERQREKEVVKRRLGTLTVSSPEIRDFVAENVEAFNGQKGEPRSFDLLDELLSDQAYRLSYWRVASDEINYRRFFDINDLAALSMERPEVFAATHVLILTLLREGKVDGLRIDHPDGLFDPGQYLQRLQESYILECAKEVVADLPAYRDQPWEELEGPLCEEIHRARADLNHPLYRALYVVVEKILGTGEPLPADWPVAGTSGYDFLNVLNGLFVDTSSARAFTRLYRDWTDADDRFPEVVYEKKRLILDVSLASELNMLAHQLDRLAQRDRGSRDFTLNTLRKGLREVVACFPVYRSYISDEGVSDTDREYIERAIRRARRRNPSLSKAVFDFLRGVLLLDYPESFTEEDRAEQRRFVGKFQQVTSPVMAKGLEDTSFYVFNRLVSLNEVGGDPDLFGLTSDAVHRAWQDRQVRWPWAMSALSTHDTKRSEDVRARINVLSEIPDDLREAIGRWGERNAAHRRTLEDTPVPDANEEYLLYQTLVGAWPLADPQGEDRASFVLRIQEYMCKALREAKVHTSWANPEQEYEEAVLGFVADILDGEKGRPFLENFRPFQRRVSQYGLLNSLAQTLLRITAPGVPDTYQGTELWDFSLVDPDNRRPVDYARRRELLRELREQSGNEDRRALARELIASREDGRVKMHVTSLGLHCRRDNPGLFARGEYLPAESTGPRADHAFCFARRQGDTVALVVVPRLLTRLIADPSELPVGKAVWADTVLQVPGLEGTFEFHNVLTGEQHRLEARGGRLPIPVALALGEFPVALLMTRPRTS